MQPKSFNYSGISMKGFPGHVCDNFFAEPKKIRRAALGLDFKAPNSQGMGGLAWRCDVPITSEIAERVGVCMGLQNTASACGNPLHA